MSRVGRAIWGLVIGCGLLTAARVGAGDVTVMNDDDQLRTSEIQDVLSALSGAFATSDVSVPAAPAAERPHLAPVPVNTTFNASVPCEDGASMSMVAPMARSTTRRWTVVWNCSSIATWSAVS